MIEWRGGSAQQSICMPCLHRFVGRPRRKAETNNDLDVPDQCNQKATELSTRLWSLNTKCAVG